MSKAARATAGALLLGVSAVPAANTHVGSPEAMGSFAQMAALALGPLWIGGVFLLAAWMVQYRRRKRRGAGWVSLLVHQRATGWALATAVLGAALTLVLADDARLEAYRDAQRSFQQQVERAQNAISQEVVALAKPLGGMRGAFAIDGAVSRREFAAMVDALDLPRNYPGIRGIGFAERVTPSALQAYLARQERIDGQAATMRPVLGNLPEPLEAHFRVQHIEPLAANRQEVGLDFASEPRRRAAMLAALQSGEPSMTRKTALAIDPLHRPGFSVFVPVYGAGSERQPIGLTFAPVVWAELMASSPARDDLLVKKQIFDGPNFQTADLLYDSDFPTGEQGDFAGQRGPRNALFTDVRPVRLFDQVVYVRASSAPAFESGLDRRSHLLRALAGGLLSGLAALVVWLLIAGRSRAERLARSMTADLDRLAMVAKRTTNAVIMTDAQQRITWVNEGFTRITGYGFDEVMGRVPGHFLQSERTDKAVARAIGEDLRALRVSRHMIQNRHKDGHHYWLDIEIQPVLLADGSLGGFMAMESDVTTEVEAREALARETERAHTILEGTGVGTWETNMVTGESQWSDRWGSMMGYARHEVVPNAAVFWRAVLHPDDLKRVENATKLCNAGATDGYACEVRVRHQDGSWMWILTRAKVMSRLPDGRVEWLGGIQTDITESKRTELNLRDVEASLGRAGQLSGVGAWEIGLQSGEIIWSDQTCAIYGVPPGHRPTMEEMLAFYPEHARLALVAAMDRAKERGLSWDLTTEMVDADGEPRWVRTYGDVEFNDSGPVRLVGAFQDVTQDRKTQLQMQRSAALLRGAIDAINEAFVVYDPQDRLVFCNDKYRALYAESAEFMTEGATFESILRGGLSKGQYAAALGREEAWLAERLAQHRAGNITLEQQLADGRWLKVVERKMADGHIVGFRVDVTSLKEATARAESVGQSLALEQRRLRSILEGTNVGTWEWIIDTGAVTFNDRWAEIAGYTLDELAPIDINTWITLSHPDDLLRSNERLQAHFENRSEFYECEVRVRHKDGHWVWALDRGRVSERTPEGKPISMSGTHMDISERKRAEQSLAETSAMLQNVLDSAVNVGIVSAGLDRVVRVFNKGAENLLGYFAHEVVGHRTSSLFFDMGELNALRKTLELQQGRNPTIHEVFDHVVGIRDQQEWTFVRQNGERFRGSLIVSPMRDAAGQTLGHLAILYDISKQKEVEASLRQAMVLAEQSNVAKSQFLANMSHEIRTPMNAVLGMLQLLGTTTLDSRQGDYVQKADGAARSLLGLLNDILDFSKVEAGKMQLAHEEFSMAALHDELSVILASNLGDKPVDLVFEVDPAIPDALVGDSLRIKQVLINLAGNAVKFTAQGHVVVRWALLERSPEAVRLHVSVRDTGIGIAPENQARIFEAFTQAEANTTRRFGGTGLGLVICTRLIRMMGGEIVLHSAVGQGSTFSFELALAVPQTQPLLIAAAPAHAVARRVLVVDDNPVALASSVSMAQSLGWTVAQAQNVPQALEVLSQELADGQGPWDAVLMDARLQGASAAESVDQMRHVLIASPQTKFLVVGVQSDRQAQQGSGASPFDGVLVRPLTARMLAQSVDMAQQAKTSPSWHAAQTSAHVAPGARRALHGMRILLVEDNPINQQVASELLRTQGAEVTVADNGALGLQAIAQAQPLFDAVLMDLQMPEMDGLTAARLLRQDARFQALPVVAMTANAMASDRQACLEAGMNDHVGKPFDLHDLVNTLVRVTQWAAVAAGDAGVLAAPSAASEAPSRVWPAGLDIDRALARMGGNAAVLLQSIAAFVDDAATVCDRVAQQLSQGDAAAATRTLHSLKGLAATLGALGLAALAADAEKTVAGAAGSVRTDALLQDIARSLAEVLPGLQTVAAQLGGAREVSDGPPTASALPALHTLLQALQDGDMTALELHAELRPHVPARWADWMAPLDAALADLELELAAVECEKLIALVSAT
jgi:PAS domain S-box-containing protein